MFYINEEEEEKKLKSYKCHFFFENLDMIGESGLVTVN